MSANKCEELQKVLFSEMLRHARHLRHRHVAGMAGIRSRWLSTVPVAPRGVTVVHDAASAQKVLQVLERAPKDTYHAWDTEVSNIDVKSQSPVGNGTVICASFYAGPHLDFGSGPRVWIDNMDEARGTLDLFKDFLQSKGHRKVWHNYGFDRHVLYNHGNDAQGLAGDTMHMARLWDTSRLTEGGYSLEGLTATVLNNRKVPMKELFGRAKLKKVRPCALSPLACLLACLPACPAAPSSGA